MPEIALRTVFILKQAGFFECRNKKKTKHWDIEVFTRVFVMNHK